MSEVPDPPCKNCITLAICVGKVRELKEDYQFTSRLTVGSIYLTPEDYDSFQFQVEIELRQDCELLREYFNIDWSKEEEIVDRKYSDWKIPKNAQEKKDRFEEVFKEDYPDYSDGEKLYYGRNGKVKKGKLIIDFG